ncbi:hypothetical protein BD289DRAFT_420995 [Coniella lustricola]|uniref:Uncharacterized protein n=1 Tax=Coniella lustricola TaxID=2025994 RepID=A0A2T3AMT6_9PEZI|nr:hypothetical protein BD289DRAFT_420995 [Coniella lustricola]
MATNTPIQSPNLRDLLSPLLPSLPAAALSSQPAPLTLRLLSPILRQRVQLLASTTSNEPWLRLLTYDKAAEARLSEVARSDRLEPHPVSGEVEVDWDYDVETQFRRVDEETLQGLVVMPEFELLFRLVWCVNDEAGEGAPDGWRVGEVSVPEKSSPFASFNGHKSIREAEEAFRQKSSSGAASLLAPKAAAVHQPAYQVEQEQEEEDDDDDDYWARYDATPARSPAPPAPGQQSQQHGFSSATAAQQDTADEDDAYYAQYDSVQPAMDNHDPDEAQVAEQHGISTAAAPTATTQQAAPPLGLQRPTTSTTTDTGSEDADAMSCGWTLAPSPSARSQEDEQRTAALAHPRPSSSASSNGSATVLKLQAQAERREQSEFGVKQHVSRSIRSLFQLSRAAGIDREEFERMVQAELDVLGMVEDDV